MINNDSPAEWFKDDKKMCVEAYTLLWIGQPLKTVESIMALLGGATVHAQSKAEQNAWSECQRVAGFEAANSVVMDAVDTGELLTTGVSNRRFNRFIRSSAFVRWVQQRHPDIPIGNLPSNRNAAIDLVSNTSNVETSSNKAASSDATITRILLGALVRNELDGHDITSQSKLIEAILEVHGPILSKRTLEDRFSKAMKLKTNLR